MTNLPDVPGGATWRCADLHLHTPGVTSFELPSWADVQRAADQARLADEYVQRLRVTGIEVAAITDYQEVRQPWFRLIHERAAEAGIIVLPGAEMSIGQGAGKGLHLILICGPDTPPERIGEVIRHEHDSAERLLPAGVRVGHRDIRLRSSLQEALRAVRDQLGCVVIAPHALEDNGMIKVLGSQQAAELVRDGLIDAIDHCESARAKLQSTGILTSERLGTLACTLSSDPKSLEDIGAKKLTDGRRRLTWIKLGTVDAVAFRLALHDPQTRLLTRPPEPAQHPRVISMEVSGGFLDGLAVRFNDDLTTLIGGRGAGKSAILETFRYGLGGDAYSDQSERQSLVRHALGSGGRVRLVIDRPGARRQWYEVTRVLDQLPRVTDFVSGAAVGVPPMELFGPGGSPVILLQREIQAVARDDSFRRRLLDEIIGDDARENDAAVRRIIQELGRNARAIEELERQAARRDEYGERLNRLNSDIAYYEQQGVAERLERHSKIGSDRARLETAAHQLADTLGSHADSAATVADRLADSARGLSAAESEQAEMLRGISEDIGAVRQQVVEANARIADMLTALQDRVDAKVRAWRDLAASLDEDLRRVQRELGSGQIDAGQYVALVSERTALEPIVEAMARLDEERAVLLEERRGMLRRLQDERHGGFTLRQRAASEVNDVLDGRLRMNVTYLGDTDEFATRLLTLLKGSGVTSDTVRIIAATPGIDGVELALAVEQGEAAVLRRFQVTEAMARRLVDWMASDSTRMRQIDVLAPGDRVAIALIDVDDGSAVDLAKLSSGQKATALLLLLFAQGRRPLILDQPEDDLDNRFVYEDVVGLLRAEKGVADPGRRRQIIVATHNANIPVNGDAELVVSLADVSGRCQVRARASIDDSAVRHEIRTVLEGGAEAFRRRAEKYGGLDDA